LPASITVVGRSAKLSPAASYTPACLVHKRHANKHLAHVPGTAPISRVRGTVGKRPKSEYKIHTLLARCSISNILICTASSIANDILAELWLQRTGPPCTSTVPACSPNFSITVSSRISGAVESGAICLWISVHHHRNASGFVAAGTRYVAIN
jgi:hypothetical protein